MNIEGVVVGLAENKIAEVKDFTPLKIFRSVTKFLFFEKSKVHGKERA